MWARRRWKSWVSFRYGWIDKPGAVAQLKDAIVELMFIDVGQDPFQEFENGPAVGLAQRDHDDSAVAVESMRDGVEEIPIRGEQDGSVVLGGFIRCSFSLTARRSVPAIRRSLVAGSTKIEDLMPCGFEEGDCRLREILVEQELHAKAS
jgi:hypothetical protein